MGSETKFVTIDKKVGIGMLAIEDMARPEGRSVLLNRYVYQSQGQNSAEVSLYGNCLEPTKFWATTLEAGSGFRVPEPLGRKRAGHLNEDICRNALLVSIIGEVIEFSPEDLPTMRSKRYRWRR